MPDQKISALTSGGALQPNDELVVARGAANNRISGGNFPAILFRQGLVSVANSTTEFSIASANVPGGELGTDRMIEWRLGGTMASNVTPPEDRVLRIKFGGTEIYNSPMFPLGVTLPRPFVLRVAIMANGSADSQTMSGLFIQNITTSASIGLGQISSDEIMAVSPIANRTVAIDSSAIQAFAITIQNSTANTGYTLTSFGGTLTRY